MESSSDNKRIERVVLACIQCRSRHVKCGSEQPGCNRCKCDGKECMYQKSRRGGLDKAALERRRVRLLREGENGRRDKTCSQDDEGSRHYSSTTAPTDQSPVDMLISRSSGTGEARREKEGKQVAFRIDNERLLDLFFSHFWPSFPIILPLHHLRARLLLHENHGTHCLIPVLHWIGSLYAPWTPSEPFYDVAAEVMNEASLAHTPFNVQALVLFALAQYHSDMKTEARKSLDKAIDIALDLRMHERYFAQLYGEGGAVLEESWRRTWYVLYIVDQHFAVVSNSPFYTLLTVGNTVDLPCEDGAYEAGRIPTPATWAEYESREFTEEEEERGGGYASLVYAYDIAMIVAYVMRSVLSTGGLSETIVETVDAKLAAWYCLLPASKKDPMRSDGGVDEVIFMAHATHAVVLSTLHRPFSSLTHSPLELSTQSFSPPSPFVLPSRAGRKAHTARALKATEMLTRLLAVPCAMERHNVFSMCITAQLTAVQISACANLLDGRAESIARDRMRLGIGYLSAMGSVWALGKKMAGEVRGVAWGSLAGGTVDMVSQVMDAGAAAEINLPRDELVSPVDPRAQIDIYRTVAMPVDWDRMAFGYSSSTSPALV